MVFEGKELKAYWCQQCDKPRLYRDFDYTVVKEKQEYTTWNKETVELFSDVCAFCDAKNNKRYFVPPKSEAKKILKALAEGKGTEASLEDLL